MKIAVIGCAGGELDKIYDAVRRVQDKHGITIDLLICCGDFQAVRDKTDLEGLNCHPNFRKMRDFHKYYKGQKKAPVTTIFIGGRDEVPGYMRELYYGGWVAPNIYYMGFAGVVRAGPLRIAGLSGLFRPSDYFTGHYECPPYNDTTRQSSCNVREWDVSRLERLTEPVDIVVSHDWPRGIWKHGNIAATLEQKENAGDLRQQMDANALGNLGAMDLLKKLRPGFWFSAHLDVKFPALVPHEDGTFTRFLALSKCWSSNDSEFLQVLDVEPRSPSFLRSLKPAKGLGRRVPQKLSAEGSARLDYDPEWLAIQKVNHGNILFNSKNQKATVVTPTKEEIAVVVRRLREKTESVPRVRAASRRHPSLLPTKLREASETTSLRDLSTSKLRELFESRRMEFPGHLDKSSLIRKLEEHDEFFAAERNAEQTTADEAFPMLTNFKADRSNPAKQRCALLDILDLEDVWKKQEDEARQLAILRGEISTGRVPASITSRSSAGTGEAEMTSEPGGCVEEATDQSLAELETSTVETLEVPDEDAEALREAVALADAGAAPDPEPADAAQDLAAASNADAADEPNTVEELEAGPEQHDVGQEQAIADAAVEPDEVEPLDVAAHEAVEFALDATAHELIEPFAERSRVDAEDRDMDAEPDVSASVVDSTGDDQADLEAMSLSAEFDATEEAEAAAALAALADGFALDGTADSGLSDEMDDVEDDASTIAPSLCPMDGFVSTALPVNVDPEPHDEVASAVDNEQEPPELDAAAASHVEYLQEPQAADNGEAFEAADEMDQVAAEIEAAEAFLQELTEVLADPVAETSTNPVAMSHEENTSAASEDGCPSDVAVEVDDVAELDDVDDEVSRAALCNALADAFEDDDEELEDEDEAAAPLEPPEKLRRIA